MAISNKPIFLFTEEQLMFSQGGFPCQPYSQVGLRLGKEDERHLWPEMRRAVREIQPPWVVGENVRGLINWDGGVVFDEVQADLETEGYKVFPFLLPAAGVNAPHERYRVWIIAYAHKYDYRRCGYGEVGPSKGKTESERDQRERLRSEFAGVSEERTPSHAYGSGIEGGKIIGVGEQFEKTGFSEFGRLFRTAWEVFPTQSPVCDGDDGLSSRLDGITFPKWRSESLKAGGNAIIPQIGFNIFKTIEAWQRVTQ